MNKYISEHLEEIHKKAAEHKFKFIYVPEMVDIPQEEFASIFTTYNSVLTSDACSMLRKITTAQFTKELLKEIDTGTNECRCGFLKLAKYDYTEPFHRGICKGMIFSYADFKLEDKQLLETAMDDLYEFFLVRIGDEGLYYTAKHNEFHPINPSQFLEIKGFSLDQADNFFRVEPMSMKLIAEEIRTRIEILKQGGYMELLMHTIGEDLLRQLANAQHRSFELPRIKITDDMKIVMPELDNREAKMPALARAMYIFFLRHEEGVEFKQLADFKNEIFAIYRLASNRTDETKLRATVAQLVNPTENKVNECASRIKEAFIRIMDDYQAKNYYLTQKGVKYKTTYLFDKNRVIYNERLIKKVALPRTLVEYPQCLTDLPKDTPKSHEDQVRLEREFEYRVLAMSNLMSYFLNGANSERATKAKQAANAVLEIDQYNYLAHFYLGILYCNKTGYATSIKENTIVLEHDDYLWNTAYINRAEAYLYAKEYDKGLADIRSYFNTVRRTAEADKEAMRIRKLLEKGKKQ